MLDLSVSEQSSRRIPLFSRVRSYVREPIYPCHYLPACTSRTCLRDDIFGLYSSLQPEVLTLSQYAVLHPKWRDAVSSCNWYLSSLAV